MDYRQSPDGVVVAALAAAAAGTNRTGSSNSTADGGHIDIDTFLLDSYQRNRSIENPAYTILIILYICLIVLGTTGNILVVLAVLRKDNMRNARNMFIVNLAVSDLLLCIVTMPLTLMEILAKYWPLGNYSLVCKMIGTLQATSIFVSTISITAIAMDRYQVIVYPTRNSLQCMGAALILLGIWLLALLLASPMILFKTLAQFNVNLHEYGIHDVVYCMEDWPIEHGRAYYSLFSLFIQYLLPIMIVSAAYSGIYEKLRGRMQLGGGVINSATAAPNTPATTKIVDKAQRDRKLWKRSRMRRTNCMLVSIAVIFGISWLPLNLFNLFSDIYMTDSSNTQSMIIAYAVCHMMGMSSACSNPFMYGWLNEQFRREFREILCLPPQGVCLVTANENSGDRARSAASTAGRNSAGWQKNAGQNSAEHGAQAGIMELGGEAATGSTAVLVPACGSLLNEQTKFLSEACSENGASTELTVLCR